MDTSTSAELLLRLRCLAILHGRIRPDLAVTGGVETPHDGIKAILASANVVQTVSALLRHGPGFMRMMVDGLNYWMEWHDLASVNTVRGQLSLQHAADPSAFERANYIRTLHLWNK